MQWRARGLQVSGHCISLPGKLLGAAIARLAEAGGLPPADVAFVQEFQAAVVSQLQSKGADAAQRDWLEANAPRLVELAAPSAEASTTSTADAAVA